MNTPQDPNTMLLDMLGRTIQALGDTPTRADLNELKEAVAANRILIIGERGDNGLTSHLKEMSLKLSSLEERHGELHTKIEVHTKPFDWKIVVPIVIAIITSITGLIIHFIPGPTP